MAILKADTTIGGRDVLDELDTHKHSAADITSGTLSTARGGTGNANGTVAKLTTSRNFQTNLASTSTASFNGSANCTPGVTGTLPIANGGTGATTAAAACANLGALPLTGGTLTGNLRLKNSSNYGMKLNFGDGEYVYLYESSDDRLEIKSSGTTLTGTLFMPTIIVSAVPSSMSSGQVAFVYT